MGKLHDDEVNKRIDLKFSRFEYAGGYTGSGGYLYLICKDCGNAFRFNAQIARLSNNLFVLCPKCNKELRRKEREQQQEQKNAEKEMKKDFARFTRFLKRFNDRYGHAFEYVSGYKSNDVKAKIEIRCKECGATRWRSRSKIFEKGENIACRECDANRKGVTVAVCVECGKEFKQYSPQQILCKECHEKQERQKRNAYHGARERRARANGKVDYSITLEKLIKRDKHICKLCGGKVNENDYVYVGDTFIAGNDYPSIDHIIPLSKGGVHQWNNVQLAHRLCNSIKCDKE